MMWVTGATVLGQALNVVSGPLVARMLEPRGRGEYATASSVVVFVGIVAAGGFPVAVVRAVSSSGAAARDVLGPLLSRTVRSALLWALPSGLLVFVVLKADLDTVALSAVSAGLAVLAILQHWMNAMLRGEGNLRRVIGQGFVGLAIYVVGVVCLFVFAHRVSPAGLAAVSILSSGLGLALGWRLLRPRTGAEETRVDPTALRTVARRGFIGSIGGLDALGLDVLVIAALLGPVATGYYAIARTVTNFPFLLLSNIAVNMLPRWVVAHEAGRRREALRPIALAVGATILMVVGVEIVLQPVIRVFFGDAYLPAVGCGRVLALGLALAGIRRLLVSLLQAQGRVRTGSRNEAGVALAMLVAMTVGARLGGLQYATGGLLAGALVGLLVMAGALTSSPFGLWTRPRGRSRRRRGRRPEPREHGVLVPEEASLRETTRGTSP
jgi:PST family polysaccharide transporter